MDENNENDQFIQKFEKKLKIQQESQDTKVESPYQNPFNANEKRFSLISPMYELVVNQMNVIKACFFVHSLFAIVEEDGENLAEGIKQIPQQLSDILVESVNIRNNLIEITGILEQLSKGIAKFVKFTENEKFQNKPLDKFLHYIETPEKRLKIILGKTCELDTQKVSTLKNNLVVFMNISGSKAIPDWVNEQAQCKKELENHENERQRIFTEDIMGYEEVAKIIGEMEFYQSQLTDHEYLKNDLQKEKKILQEHRDILERQALESATRIRNFFHFMNNNLDVLREQKKIVKQEISEIDYQENQKNIYESVCKRVLASLTEKLKLAKKRVERAKITKETRLSNIDEQIARKKKEVNNFEEEILQILRKYGNPSINSTCLLLESLAGLASQQVQGTAVSTSYHTIVGSLLAGIEQNIESIREAEGDRDLLDIEIMDLETSVVPINFFVSEIRPIIRNSIYGISSQELAKYSAGKALEPGLKN
ncbi:unnamed protein product [Rhizophagus irregularis]|nr:unnamed protein product [Rhizophagus irregularis]